jgi:UDP-N-acetylmuramate--alanine ligase
MIPPPDAPWRDELRRRLAAPPSRVHLMGIGGIGMAGLARLLAARGHAVSGCDGAEPRTLAWLRSCGIPADVGHAPSHLDAADWAIYSPALPPGHPERREAERRGIPLYRRGQVLPVLAESWQTVAIAGTHGKTTTSSMVAHLLRACGVDASWCIGGELPPHGAPAGVGASPWLVLEADESDGTLAHYAPHVAVVANVEFDHMEHFPTREAMLDCFRAFARQARHLVCGADDPQAARLAADFGAHTAGFAPSAHYRAQDPDFLPDGTRFILRAPQGPPLPVHLPLAGRHNVLNALAALAACDRCGVDLPRACAALASFALPRRRFELVAHARGVRILADYAHHPSEIRALVDAARQAGAPRIRAIFQPHRYTRTLALGPDFPPAFHGVADLVLAPVYPASEPPLPGGTSANLLAHFRSHPDIPVQLADDLPDAARLIASRWQPGDWILLVGAGDVESLAPPLKARLLSTEPFP